MGWGGGGRLSEMSTVLPLKSVVLTESQGNVFNKVAGEGHRMDLADRYILQYS